MQSLDPSDYVTQSNPWQYGDDDDDINDNDDSYDKDDDGKSYFPAECRSSMKYRESFVQSRACRDLMVLLFND